MKQVASFGPFIKPVFVELPQISPSLRMFTKLSNAVNVAEWRSDALSARKRDLIS